MKSKSAANTHTGGQLCVRGGLRLVGHWRRPADSESVRGGQLSAVGTAEYLVRYKRTFEVILEWV